MALSPQHMQLAHQIAANGGAGGALHAKLASNPATAPHVAAIMSDPTAAAIVAAGSAAGGLAGPGGSGGAGPHQQGATDPSGAFNPNRALGYGGSANQRRRANIRHQILGFASAALISGGTNQKVTAKPQVAFKATRLVLAPAVVTAQATIGSTNVGTVNQLAANTVIPADVFSPTSYAGDLDLSLCKAALDITMLVNTPTACTWYAGFTGLVQGKPIRPAHTKVQGMGLTPTEIDPGQTKTILYNPQIDFVPRKVALTPGAGFADNLIITNVQCGQMNQLASGDPYPGALHSDLFPLDLDWDMISAAVALQFTVFNAGAAGATFQGIAYGDVNPAQLANPSTAYGV